MFRRPLIRIRNLYKPYKGHVIRIKGLVEFLGLSWLYLENKKLVHDKYMRNTTRIRDLVGFLDFLSWLIVVY